jgi:cell shape-determining protein MreC
MTTLGKILVFVNLVFSLVTGALIIMVFSARTNWHSYSKKAEAAVNVANANMRAYAEEVKLTKAKWDKEAGELRDQLTKLTAEREQLQKDILDKDNQFKQQLAQFKEVNTNAQGSTRELKQREGEVKQLQTTIAAMQQKQLDLEALNDEIRRRYIRADIAARTLQDRLKRMNESLEAVTKENDRLKHGTAIADDVKPPEDVKGIVLNADHKNQLITISIGSDAGLAKGHTLDVYQLGAEPKYKGKIRIIEVNHHEAVARPLNMHLAALIRKGDTVASDILGQR